MLQLAARHVPALLQAAGGPEPLGGAAYWPNRRAWQVGEKILLWRSAPAGPPMNRSASGEDCGRGDDDCGFYGPTGLPVEEEVLSVFDLFDPVADRGLLSDESGKMLVEPEALCGHTAPVDLPSPEEENGPDQLLNSWAHCNSISRSEYASEVRKRVGGASRPNLGSAPSRKSRCNNVLEPCAHAWRASGASV